MSMPWCRRIIAARRISAVARPLLPSAATGRAPQLLGLGVRGLSAESAPSAAAAAASGGWPTGPGAASGGGVAEETRPSSRTMSPYEALGLSPAASTSEVREAYLRAAKELHPDKTGGAAMTAEEMERFQEAKAAWFILGDEKRRKEYDEFGTLAAPPQAWSTSMWSRLKKSKPEEGNLMPNWGPQEPPKWFIFVAPISTVVLFVLFAARWDIVMQVRDAWALRSGGWPCPKCLIINEPGSSHCKECGDARDPYWTRPTK